MNKKEVLEIRKQFTPENCTITRICGCYVDHEKEKKMEMKDKLDKMDEKLKKHELMKRVDNDKLQVLYLSFCLITQHYCHTML